MLAVPDLKMCGCAGHEHRQMGGQCGWVGDGKGERCPCRNPPARCADKGLEPACRIHCDACSEGRDCLDSPHPDNCGEPAPPDPHGNRTFRIGLSDDGRLAMGHTKPARPTWDRTFMDHAFVAARRGTCPRKQVGAVVVDNNRVIASGYNGSVVGMAHCVDVGCDMVDGHCVRTVHAEMNALCQAATSGVSIAGATVYTTASPCWECFRVLVNAGVHRFVFAEVYRGDESRGRILAVTARHGHIRVEQLANAVAQEGVQPR